MDDTHEGSWLPGAQHKQVSDKHCRSACCSCRRPTCMRATLSMPSLWADLRRSTSCFSSNTCRDAGTSSAQLQQQQMTKLGIGTSHCIAVPATAGWSCRQARPPAAWLPAASPPPAPPEAAPSPPPRPAPAPAAAAPPAAVAGRLGPLQPPGISCAPAPAAGRWGSSRRHSARELAETRFMACAWLTTWNQVRVLPASW